MLLTNIGRLLTMERTGTRGGACGVIEDACVHVEDDRIVWVGTHSELPREHTDLDCVDCGGAVVLPGLIDCHTHLVHAGSRAHEFRRMSCGASYREIAAKGGGILSTVRATREASEDELFDAVRQRADECITRGITTAEIKSGYGLDVATEEKMLRAAVRLGRSHAIDIVPTFLGAHVVPEEYRSDRTGYVSLICEEMLPRMAGEDLCRYCDVFVEEGAFSVDEARAIAVKARSLGLGIRLHVDQFSDSGGGLLAAELGAASADHLDYVSSRGIEAMAAAGVVGVVLPTASFFTRSDRYAPARKMIDGGMRVAVSTDYNPGSSPTLDLMLAATMAVIRMGLNLDEALQAITINAAASLEREHDIGSIAPGKRADLVVFDTRHEDYLLYRFGTNLARTVIKDGSIVYSRP